MSIVRRYQQTARNTLTVTQSRRVFDPNSAKPGCTSISSTNRTGSHRYHPQSKESLRQSSSTFQRAVKVFGSFPFISWIEFISYRLCMTYAQSFTSHFHGAVLLLALTCTYRTARFGYNRLRILYRYYKRAVFLDAPITILSSEFG